MASNKDWEDGDLSFLDVITILSFLVGMENWSLNKQQIHNKNLLNRIISQNDEIIRLLKEKENAH